jgi:hypothetical protein
VYFENGIGSSALQAVQAIQAGVVLLRRRPDEQPMRFKIFSTVAVFVLSWAGMVHGQDDSKSIDSSGFIYGQINFVAAFLGECADHDKKNAATHMNLFDQYFQENNELADRITTIMRTEQIRSGQPIEALGKMLFDARRMAAETAFVSNSNADHR